MASLIDVPVWPALLHKNHCVDLSQNEPPRWFRSSTALTNCCSAPLCSSRQGRRSVLYILISTWPSHISPIIVFQVGHDQRLLILPAVVWCRPPAPREHPLDVLAALALLHVLSGITAGSRR